MPSSSSAASDIHSLLLALFVLTWCDPDLCVGVSMLLELTINGPKCAVIIKSENPGLSAIAVKSIVSLLST